MRPLYILNDLHLGVLRGAGTTPQTQLQLRDWAIQQLAELLKARQDGDVVLNGDLFDTYQIPLTDLLKVKRVFSAWLELTGNTLFLLPGNHDLSTDSSKLSSFEFMSQMLLDQHGGKVKYYEELCQLRGDVLAIPHMPNQDLFELELDKVPDGYKYLLVHCNYDNGFAKQLDHSLNLSKERAEALPVKHIIFAHEHNANAHQSGKVLIAGNPFPTSISDCLNGSQHKYQYALTDDGPQAQKTWDHSGYAEVDWRGGSVPDSAQFVRVVGDVPAADAAAAIDAVNRLRRASPAFIVGNGLRIEGAEPKDFDMGSLEAARAFDVVGALRKHLDEAQMKRVEEVL